MDKKINIMKCIICNNIIEGYGNNPAPVKNSEDGSVCNKCYLEIVLPARLSLPEFNVDFKNVKKWEQNIKLKK